jgi:hypothetical protein
MSSISKSTGLSDINELPLDVSPLLGREGPTGHDVGADAHQRFDSVGQIHEPQTDGRGHFDQDVHVAILSLLAPSVRTEEGQPRDPELPGETWPRLTEDAKNVVRALHGIVPNREYTVAYRSCESTGHVAVGRRSRAARVERCRVKALTVVTHLEDFRHEPRADGIATTRST